MPSFRVERNDGEVALTFDDGAMNLLSSEALLELERTLAAVDPDVSLLTLRSGRESLFAAGADMKAMSEFDAFDAEDFARLGQRVFAVIERLDCATLVLIDGDCYGGALDLALAFDVRVATSRSRFSHPGARIGIVTGFGGTVRVPRTIERRELAGAMLGSGVLDATEALHAGLIDAIEDDLDRVRKDAVARSTRFGAEIHGAKVARRTSAAMTQRQLLVRRTEELWRGTTH